MIDYTKPAKIDYRKRPSTTPAPVRSTPTALFRGESIDLSTGAIDSAPR